MVTAVAERTSRRNLNSTSPILRILDLILKESLFSYLQYYNCNSYKSLFGLKHFLPLDYIFFCQTFIHYLIFRKTKNAKVVGNRNMKQGCLAFCVTLSPRAYMIPTHIHIPHMLPQFNNDDIRASIRFEAFPLRRYVKKGRNG